MGGLLPKAVECHVSFGVCYSGDGWTSIFCMFLLYMRVFYSLWVYLYCVSVSFFAETQLSTAGEQGKL